MGFILTIHVFVCILLVAMILLQVGRGAITGASFGGGVRTFFGPSGAVTFLGKVIIALAVIFVVTTLILSILATGGKPPKIKSRPRESSRQEVVDARHFLPVFKATSGSSQSFGI
ncbi:MAG: preprotein translocase subunit SecG [bacterium]